MAMVKILGQSGPLLLVADDDRGVVVNTELNLVNVVGTVAELSLLHEWSRPERAARYADEVLELAESALVTLNIDVVTAAAGQRMYTIPEAAVVEAKKALKWRAEHNRGGTSVGLNTARTLARGGQIGLRKVRHVAKYFPRHEVDKQGKGWKPGEDGFPSRGRIAWALWGGDPAWRWARQIVEREDKKAKALKAGGDYGVDYDPMLDYEREVAWSERGNSDVDSFREAREMDGDYGPEFLARVCLDGSGIDRLYKIDPSGATYVWDDGSWDDLGYPDGDVYFYDEQLDYDHDGVERSHIVIDPDSAVVISARLQGSPDRRVSVEDIDSDEARMFADALGELDYDLMDRVVVAAGEAVGAKGAQGDGVYTPEERSENASKQIRNASGKFAAAGQRVAVGGDHQRGAGTIRRVNPADQTVEVELDSGDTITVPAKATGALDENKRVVSSTGGKDLTAPLDVSGILGQPRTPVDQPQARLPGTMEPMSTDDIHQLMSGWDKYVQEARDSFRRDRAGRGR